MNALTGTSIASALTAGDRYRVYGHDYRAVAVQPDVSGAGVYVTVEGQSYPEFYLNEREVEMLPEPAPAPAAATTRNVPRRRRRRRRTPDTFSIHYIDPKTGRRRVQYRASIDTIRAYADKLEARGVEIICYG